MPNACKYFDFEILRNSAEDSGDVAREREKKLKSTLQSHIH